MDSSTKADVKARVALVFPPLVETNFGCYYPSTAVLAGFLDAAGVSSMQLDLNEDFAVWLLGEKHLEAMAAGKFGKGVILPPESMPAVSARLLMRYGQSLFDDKGRHLFREDSAGPAYLLNILAKPFRLDVPVSQLSIRKLGKLAAGRAYQVFFKAAGLDSLPESIRVVGISIPVGPQLAPSLILADYIKSFRHGVKVILGGATVSLMSPADKEVILKGNPAVDALVSADGEYPLTELVQQALEGNWQPENVAGVSTMSEEQFVQNEPKAGPDLETAPYPRYEAVLLSRLAEPEIGITQARGCYWGKCAYCDYIGIYTGSPRFRTRTPRSFVSEMEYQLKTHGINRFSLITEAISPAFARKASRLILERGFKVKWHSFAMVDRRFNVSTLKQMAAAGCEFLVIGVETMTDRVLKFMDKSANRRDNIDFLEAARSAGLDLKVNLIPDLPSTTYEEAMESLNSIKGLEGCFSFVSVFPFEATISSRVGHNPEIYRLVKIEAPDTGQAQFSLNHLHVVDPALSTDDRQEVLARYNAFAARVNMQPRGSSDAQLDSAQSPQVLRLRLADEFLDLWSTDEGGIQCFNWLTRTRFQIPPDFKPIVERMQSLEFFSPDDFIGWFGTLSAGEFYLNKLLEKHIIYAETRDAGSGSSR